MTSPSDNESHPSDDFVSRLLRRLDRVPGLGGGRTHVVFLGLFFLVSLSLYLTVLKVRGPAKTFDTKIAWDDWFPFTPWWVWVYLLPYLIGPLLTGVLSRDVFAWYIRRATIVVVVSLFIFAAVPTHTIRPLREDPRNEEKLPPGVTSWMYRQMVAIDDPPANAAPSLHVSLSCLLAWALVYNYPRGWTLALGGAILVWLSTLFTRQHHLIDVATGALLASLASIGPPRRAPSVEPAPQVA